jgi:hypothetical protein
MDAGKAVDHAKGHEVLVAENVKVNMEDLRLATGWSFFNRIARSEAAMKVVDAVISGLSPEDRQRLEVDKWER